MSETSERIEESQVTQSSSGQQGYAEESQATQSSNGHRGYVVEKILAKRITKEGVCYKLKWLGFGESENTWSLERELDCKNLIEEFEKSRRSGSHENDCGEAGDGTEQSNEKDTRSSADIAEDKENKTTEPKEKESVSRSESKPARRVSSRTNKGSIKRPWMGDETETFSGESTPDGSQSNQRKSGRKKKSARKPKLYEVESILDKRVEGGITEYKVKWKGYTEITWEPIGNLSQCSDMIERLERKLAAKAETDVPYRLSTSSPSVTSPPVLTSSLRSPAEVSKFSNATRQFKVAHSKRVNRPVFNRSISISTPSRMRSKSVNRPVFNRSISISTPSRLQAEVPNKEKQRKRTEKRARMILNALAIQPLLSPLKPQSPKMVSPPNADLFVRLVARKLGDVPRHLQAEAEMDILKVFNQPKYSRN